MKKNLNYSLKIQIKSKFKRKKLKRKEKKRKERMLSVGNTTTLQGRSNAARHNFNLMNWMTLPLTLQMGVVFGTVKLS